MRTGNYRIASRQEMIEIAENGIFSPANEAPCFGSTGKGELREAGLGLTRRQSLIRPSYIMATSRLGLLFGSRLRVPHIFSNTLISVNQGGETRLGYSASPNISI